MVYSGRIGGKVYTFGVSGRLYKSNVLIYDHQTESLWSQLMETAISGPLAGSKLEKIAAYRTTWKRWRDNHPRTEVLSTDTGHARNYAIDPYEGYYRALGVMFPVGEVRKDLAAKEMVLGIAIEGIAKAYPLSELERNSGVIADRISKSEVSIELSAQGQVVEVRDRAGQRLPAIFAYWFAWQAFHPNTLVWEEAE